MRQDYDGLITFASTHQALRTEAVLDTQKVTFDIRPIPPVISAGCGLAIEFYIEQMASIMEAIDAHEILYQGLYQKKDQSFIEIRRE